MPPVTEPFHGRLLVGLNSILPDAPSSWTVLSWFGVRYMPCSGRARAAENTNVWETANLGWWDFQRRRMSSIWLTKTIYDRVTKAAAEYEALEQAGDLAKAEILWDETSAVNAREIREHAEYAKGLFVKATQQMSTMQGILPEAYCEEFLKTTETLPISSPEEVYDVVERDLQRSPHEIFEAFDQVPIASASIGQVHKARLAGSGELVAVKVQHDGVDRVFMDDLGTLASIAEQVAYWMPGIDFRKAVEEWEESVPRELDFREEAVALSRASKVLREFRSHAIVPAPRDTISNKRVLVMDYIDGWPIARLKDREFCKANGLKKKMIMRELLDALGILTFRDGLIHGDPHAGNVRCICDSKAPGGAAPVIFDWGMTRVLTNNERFILAKLFHSLANMDMTGIFEALDFLGFRFNDSLSHDFQEELVGRLRAMMKDTVSKTQTRKNTRAGMQEMKSRAEAGKKVPPGKIFDDFPKCIVFFLRMCECVRGLTVMCDVEGLPVLEIFTSHARKAFIEGSRKEAIVSSVSLFTGSASSSSPLAPSRGQEASLPWGRQTSVKQEASLPWSRQTSAKPPTSVLFPAEPLEAVADLALERRVRECLTELASRNQLVGAQVAVVQAGRVICDISFGTLSSIDMRPVKGSTRFPLLGAVAGVATLALLRDLRRWCETPSAPSHPDSSCQAALLGVPIGPGRLALVLDTSVAKFWPQFGGGSSSITLREILGHAAGLQDAFPDDFGPRYLDDAAAVLQHLELASLKTAREPRYSYILQTFVLAKLAECLGPRRDLLQWLRSTLGPLGFDAVLPAGAGGEAFICRDLPSLSRVSMGEVEQARNKRNLRKGGDHVSSEGAATPTSQRPSPSSSPRRLSVPTKTLAEAAAKSPMAFDPLAANISQASSSKGFRAGLPIATSARSLATLLASSDMHRDLEALGALLIPDERARDDTALGWFLTGGACQWTRGGLQKLQLRPLCPRTLISRRQEGYGVVCGLGPSVAHFPGLAGGEGVTVAVMVNNVLRGRDVAARLTTEVLSGYGYRPVWPRMPLHVMREARDKLSQDEMGASIIRELARIEGRGGSNCGGCLAGLQPCCV